MIEILSQAHHIHDAYSYNTFGLSSFNSPAVVSCSRQHEWREQTVLVAKNMNWINVMLISVRGVADEYNHN